MSESTHPYFLYSAAPCFVAEQWFETTVVLRCRGDLDMLTAPQLDDAVSAAESKKPAALIIDLTEVGFLASAGMSLLITAHDRIAPNAGFAVVADGPGTSRPLTLVGIATEINMQPTLDAALGSVGAAHSASCRS